MKTINALKLQIIFQPKKRKTDKIGILFWSWHNLKSQRNLETLSPKKVENKQEVHTFLSTEA